MFQSGQYNVTVTNGDEVILPLKSETYTGGEQQTITVWASLESGSVLRSTDSLTASVSVSSQYGSEKASVKCNLIGNASCQYRIISQIRPPFLQTSIGYKCRGALSRDLS